MHLTRIFSTITYSLQILSSYVFELYEPLYFFSSLALAFNKRNHVFAHVQEFGFWTGFHEFKDVRINTELS